MKTNALLIFLSILTAHSSFGAEVNTSVRCEQHDDSDITIEVGIVLNDGPGFRLLVVEHNADNGSAKLLRSVQVFQTEQGEQTRFQDSDKTAQLIVSRVGDNLTGELTVLADGPGSISEQNMDCFLGGKIRFDNKKK